MSEWEAHFEIFGGCPNLFSGDLPGFAKCCLCIIMRALEVEPVVRIPYVISTPRHTRLKLVHKIMTKIFLQFTYLPTAKEKYLVSLLILFKDLMNVHYNQNQSSQFVKKQKRILLYLAAYGVDYSKRNAKNMGS